MTLHFDMTSSGNNEEVPTSLNCLIITRPCVITRPTQPKIIITWMHLFCGKNILIVTSFHTQEQIEWARDGGADFIVGATFQIYAEAAIALETCKEVAPGRTCLIL